MKNQASWRMSIGRSVAVLCMLSSSSCSAFGGPRLLVRQCCSGSLQLQYRVRDDNQPVNIHFTNSNNDIIDVSQHSNSDRPLETAASSLGVRLTSQLPLKSLYVFSSHRQLTDTDKKQLEMDEYIEYLEQRYSRINRVDIPVHAMDNNEETLRILPVGFSTQLIRSIRSTRILSPLVAPPPSLHNLPSRRNDDHLKVLGLSTLASAGLRRRLNCEDGRSDDDCDIIPSTSHYESRTGLLGHLSSTIASLGGFARAYVSLRLIQNFFMMTVIPEITAYIPEFVTSFVILLLVRPILRWGIK